MLSCHFTRDQRLWKTLWETFLLKWGWQGHLIAFRLSGKFFFLTKLFYLNSFLGPYLNLTLSFDYKLYMYIVHFIFRYELLQKGMLNEEDVRVVPDIYVKYALYFNKYIIFIRLYVCQMFNIVMLNFKAVSNSKLQISKRSVHVELLLTIRNLIWERRKV